MKTLNIAGGMRAASATALLRSVYIAALVLFLVSCVPAAAQQPVAQGTLVPVIINLYDGCHVTGVEAAAFIKKANNILNQAGYHLVVVDTNDGEDAEGDNGDGDFTAAERTAIRTFGANELNALKNQKGIKIAFGDTPTAERPTNPGVAVHENPTIIVKERATATQSAETISHEIGHVMTLKAGHKIDDSTTADAGGHAPNVPGTSGQGNLMAPSNWRTGTHLTPDQIAEMNTQRGFRAKTAAQWANAFPAIKVEQQFGTATDELDDIGSAGGWHDLDMVCMASLFDSSSIEVQLSVAGVPPDTTEFSSEYCLAFDVDASEATGVEYAGLGGVDRIVRVDLTGFFGELSATGEVENTITSSTDPLPGYPIAEVEHELYDIDADGVPVGASLWFEIPKTLLGLTAAEVPMVATAGSEAAIYDTLFLYFDTLRWLDDPTLETFGTGVPVPGEDYAFAVSGLESGSPFEVSVDDSLVLSALLDGTGSYSGVFGFPADMWEGEFHFLTAQDTTGEFAYNITSIDVTSGIDDGALPPTMIEPSPNPFSESTTVVFDLPEHAGAVRLGVYNAAGQLVKTLKEGRADRGRHVTEWDGTDNNGRSTAAGVYFVKLEVGGRQVTEKVVVLR